MNIALLVIDVQNALVEEGPYACETIICNIKQLIEKARENDIDVIYIQHKGKDGSVLEEGTDGWMIYDAIGPLPGDVVISKRFNSSFKETKLRQHLEEQGISNLVITGMQTEYCIDTTCRVAFEYGYSLIIPEMTNTTYDNGSLKAEAIYEHHNYSIFKDRFAVVESLNQTIKRLEEH